jgi:hypothetical protein
MEMRAATTVGGRGAGAAAAAFGCGASVGWTVAPMVGDGDGNDVGLAEAVVRILVDVVASLGCELLATDPAMASKAILPTVVRIRCPRLTSS